MQVLVYLPGVDPEVREIPNTLKALQSIVGGYIETVNTGVPGIILIVNEEGGILDMPLNRQLQVYPRIYQKLFGPIVACRVDHDRFESLEIGRAHV